VAAEGFDATPEEIREAFVEAFGAELSEEQLAAIAGGLSPDGIATVSFGAVIGASAIAAGAAAA
jgi:lactobin A/cerein 7B family class IIb bacteriocin